MDLSSDYRDLLKVLRKHKVKYLIVGAYAVVYYAEPRFTKDMDIWVKASLKNVAKLYKALKEFGAPLKNISPEDFTNDKTIYQIGVAPVRIDIIMGLRNIDFDSAWANKKSAKYGDIPVNILGIKELTASKKMTKRPQDELDLKSLSDVKRKYIRRKLKANL